jgi:hypothetical protein
MSRIAMIAAVTSAIVLLSACDSPDIPMSAFDGRVAYPSSVQRKTAYLDIAPPLGGAPVAPDKTRVNEFVDAYKNQGESPIAVTITAPTLSDPAARKEAVDVAVMLRREGIPASDIKLFVKELRQLVGTDGANLAQSGHRQFWLRDTKECRRHGRQSPRPDHPA